MKGNSVKRNNTNCTTNNNYYAFSVFYQLYIQEGKNNVRMMIRVHFSCA